MCVRAWEGRAGMRENGRRLPGGRRPCSSQQDVEVDQGGVGAAVMVGDGVLDMVLAGEASLGPVDRGAGVGIPVDGPALGGLAGDRLDGQAAVGALRSEEHTSELQSLMR